MEQDGGVRLVACDLDGTIVDAQGQISARTLAAFAECERQGVQVVFVTGRPPRWLAPVAKLTGHRGMALCGNGAVVLDLATNQVVQADPLSPATVLAVTEKLRAVLPGIVFALETTDGYRREPMFVPRHEAALAAQTGTIEELLVGAPVIIKVLARLDRSADPAVELVDTDTMLERGRAALAGVAEVVHSNPQGRMLEIAAPGVTKASALARLAGELGVDAADVVAFGDMPNDVPMLEWAGAGYAMSGGHPLAIAAAARTAPPLAEDGVAQVIEELLAGAAPARQGTA
jgi:Cof subfamily protein (haloacid dehalogenase superfamily)